MGVPSDNWTVRELIAAAEEKDRVEWEARSYSTALIINAMPSFSKRGRRPVQPYKINPKRRRGPRGVPMGPQAEAILDAAAEKG